MRMFSDHSDCMRDAAEIVPTDVFPISGTNLGLAMIACGVGAYNVTQAVYILDPSARGSRRVRPAATNAQGQTLTMLSNPTLDGPTITAISYQRGLGDCFGRGTYRFDGRVFRTVLIEIDDACDGRQAPRVTYRAE